MHHSFEFIFWAKQTYLSALHKDLLAALVLLGQKCWPRVVCNGLTEWIKMRNLPVKFFMFAKLVIINFKAQLYLLNVLFATPNMISRLL